jgi:chorismate dehydratase
VIFGSISYLNLLPFQVFMKRYIKHTGLKMGMNYRRDVPSQINKALKKRQIDAGFISSIESPHYQCSNLGIIANGAVYSVFVIQGENQTDIESASSNRLAKVLKLQGEVLIGDKALVYYLKGGEGIDLATQWHNQTKLPFVFARLCYTCHGKTIEKIAKKFSKQPIKIPQYILKREANKRAITPSQLLWYLNHIEYNMNHKSKKSLKLFLKKSKGL